MKQLVVGNYQRIRANGAAVLARPGGTGEVGLFCEGLSLFWRS